MKFVTSFIDNRGTRRYRFRRTGVPTHYFHAEFGTPQFEREYQDYLAIRPHESPRQGPERGTVERLREHLNYDPETGIFTWKDRRRMGKRAGCICTHGYRQISFDSRHHREHRLAWFYMTGRWPAEEIDHINGVRDDNRWVNLREATHAENIANRKLGGRGQICGPNGGVGIIGNLWRLASRKAGGSALCER